MASAPPQGTARIFLLIRRRASSSPARCPSPRACGEQPCPGSAWGTASAMPMSQAAYHTQAISPRLATETANCSQRFSLVSNVSGCRSQSTSSICGPAHHRAPAARPSGRPRATPLKRRSPECVCGCAQCAYRWQQPRPRLRGFAVSPWATRERILIEAGEMRTRATAGASAPAVISFGQQEPAEWELLALGDADAVAEDDRSRVGDEAKGEMPQIFA